MIGPVRTCIGCRERSAKYELVRLVWRAPDVQADPRQIESGRGAYLHPRTQCLDLAVRKRAVGRALRVPATNVTLESVRATLERTGESASAKEEG